MDKNIEIQVWDKSTMLKYSVISTLAGNMDGALLVFDLTQRKSFQELEKYEKTVKR